MRLICAAALCGALAMPAVAQAQWRQACKVHVLCAGVQPGGGRIMQCLRDKRGSLSVACKLALADFFLSRNIMRQGGGGGAGGSRGGDPDMGPERPTGPDRRGGGGEGSGPRPDRAGGPDRDGPGSDRGGLDRGGPDGLDGPDGPPPPGGDQGTPPPR